MSTADGTERTSDLFAAFAGDWSLDSNNTTIEFETKSLWGLLGVKGSFKVIRGIARVTESRVEGSTTIDASSVDTGSEKIDQHLKSSDWLDSVAHPTFEYSLQDIAASGDHTVRLDGILRVREFARPLVIVATVVPSGDRALDLRFGI